MPVVKTPAQHNKIRLEKEQQIARYAAQANSDALGLDMDESDETSNSRKKNIKRKKTVRLHPDFIDAISAFASDQRKDFSEALRDLLLEGFRSKGINLKSLN